MSQEIEEKREHLEALKAFLRSSAYIGYLTAIQTEINENCAAQVAIIPDNLADIVELIKLKGEHRCLTESLTRFEDARTRLSDRIDEMVEAELESATTSKR